MSASPEELVRPEVLAMNSYRVVPSSGMIKLDAMENPYRLPGNMRDMIAALAHDTAFNRYPDASASELKTALRDSMRIPDEAALLLGNGSDELIQIIELALARPGATVLAPEPSFVMYRQIARYCGLRFVGVPLRVDFSLDMRAMLDAIARERPAAVFLSYPHNPSGTLFPQVDIETIVREAPGVVVLDEAYTHFAGSATMMARVTELPNLIVIRTLSKLGLAGLRLGYLAGRPEWVEQFDKVRLPYNLSTMTQAIATRVLGSLESLENQAMNIVQERARLFEELSALQGVKVFPSHANFLLVRVDNANRIFEALLERQVLVKNLHGTHPLLDNCLRVTIGTPTENGVFLAQFLDSL